VIYVFFALSAADNSFIVRAGTVEELAEKIDDIIANYADFTARYIVPGVRVVEAKDLPKAKKAGSNHATIFPDLPLFGAATP